MALPENMTILSASSGEQNSVTYEEKGHGLCSCFLLKVIKEGHAELENLYGYLKLRVRNVARKKYNNEQIPGLSAPEGLLTLKLYDR